MPKLPVRAVTGETFCHESEDMEKVRKSFEMFFPKKEIKQKTQQLAFSTEIKILTARLEGKKARDLAKKILETLSAEEKKKITNELNLRLTEEGKLYLRLDKQRAFSNEKIVLTEEEDSIQIVLALEAFPATESGFIKGSLTLLA